jgi:hypothetical protein
VDLRFGLNAADKGEIYLPLPRIKFRDLSMPSPYSSHSNLKVIIYITLRPLVDQEACCFDTVVESGALKIFALTEIQFTCT